MAKRLAVPARVAKWLYAASGNQCAFPECTEVLIQPPDENGEVVLTSNIAHIVAASEDGPRGESDLTDEQRVQPKNLVLVCHKHHAIIDTLIKTHGVDFVTRIKLRHEEMIERRHAVSVDITNLPRDTPFLAGRDTEITDSMRYLTDCPTDNGGPTVLVITGPPGIGKTALAVHLAYEAATHFADGQVFVSGAMRAPTTEGQSQLADVIFRALNVQNSATATSPETTNSALAEALAGRRMLIVIDDLATETALCELLAVNANLHIICTARSRFSGLIDFKPFTIDLGPLPDAAGADLAMRTAGTERISDAAAAKLSSACYAHPLAIKIAASRIATRPNMDVEAYLRQLGDPEKGTRALSIGERSIAPVIDSSYALLDGQQINVLQALSLLPNVPVPLAVVAAATCVSLDDFDAVHAEEVTDQLDALFELNLVEQPAVGVYKLHGIIYSHARSKASLDSGLDRATVISNGCVAYAALVGEALSGLDLSPSSSSEEVPTPNVVEILKQLEHDRPGCVEIVETACRERIWNPLVLLASALTPALYLRSAWSDLGRVYECVSTAAEHVNNDEWRVASAHNLGSVAAYIGDTAKATELYRRTAGLAETSENPLVAYIARVSYGSLLFNSGHARDSIPLFRSSLKAWRYFGAEGPLASTLLNLGQAYLSLGEWGRAETYLRNGRRLALRLDGRTLDPHFGIAISTLLRHSGKVHEAHAECVRALECARSVGHRDLEVGALLELGIIRQHRDINESSIEPLNEALAISKELHYARGELTASRLLGTAIRAEGKLAEADEMFDQCFKIAMRIGEVTEAALCLTNKATILADLGRIDDAKEMFELAEDIALGTNSEFAVAQVRYSYALLLTVTGEVARAVEILRQALNVLKTTGNSDIVANAQVALGEALMYEGQWEAAARALRATADAGPGTISEGVRATALRRLSVLYARRSLWREAHQVLERAFSLIARTGDVEEEMHCHAARGTLLARMAKWTDALAAFDEAYKLAAARRDSRVLLVIRINQVACHSGLGRTEKVAVETEELIALAKRLGLAEIEVGLHVNVGSHHAQSGDLDAAIPKFESARTMAARLGLRGYEATALINLARVWEEKGEPARAHASATAALEKFQHLGDWVSAANALLIEIKNRPGVDSLLRTARSVTDLVSGSMGIKNATIAALESRLSNQNYHLQLASPEARRREIRISERVKEELADVDIDSLLDRLAESRQVCFVCDLPMAEEGNAELIVVGPRSEDLLTLRLAHPSCCPSSVVVARGERKPTLRTDLEIECVLLADDAPAVVIDCYGGWGAIGTGKVEDLLLASLRSLGFTDVTQFITLDEPGKVHHELPSAGLAAILNGNRLTLRAGTSPIMEDAPLLFIPEWYRAARSGALLVMFGRNLQGMVWQDQSYAIRAAEKRQLVCAAAKLATITPGRNSRCVCSPPSGLKFKKCCGKPG